MKEAVYPANPVLVVDDETAWLRSLGLLLERSLGINNIILAEDGREALEILGRVRVSLVLLDVTMPHLSGEQVLEKIMEDFPEIPVIINTGRGEVDIAVRCMQMGARDYFLKTVEPERLIAGIRSTLALESLREENLRLKEGLVVPKLKYPEVFAPITTRCPEVLALFRYIEAIGTSREPVLITGESGTGKELFSKAVHQVCSRQGPWRAVNVAGLDDNVFSDTLFGHVRGAFTGADRLRGGLVEEAAGGTLFLDEVGDLSLSSQVKLLRLLQEGEYYPLGSDSPKKANIRIVAATNHDLEGQVASGRFRRDLYYRLKLHHVNLPPLRERLEDLPMLVDVFLEEAANSVGKPKPSPPPELYDLLGTYHFPGNVRELRGMVYDAVTRHRKGKLSLRTFEQATGIRERRRGRADAEPQGADGEASLIFTERLPTLKDAADLLVAEAMRRSGGNQTLASKLLGISRPALSKRLNK